MTVRIGICDDEKVFLGELLEKISAFFNKEAITATIKTYNNGHDLLSESNNVDFDILFLDIDMPQISGIEIAEQIRKKNQMVHIIFITNHDDLVFQSIKYQPFRFIRKRWLKEELEEALIALKQKLNSQNSFFVFKFNGTESAVRYVDIIYVESFKHDIFIHTTKETYRIKNSIGKLEKDFAHYGFIRIHSGYLVNFRYIFSIEKTRLLLLDKGELPVSRHRLDTVKQKLQLYIRQGV